MYAIVRTGGKQYRVEPGSTVYLERLQAAVGETIALEEVLLVSGQEGTQVGTPCLENVRVQGTVIEQGRDRKVRVFKYKKRKHYRRTRGHRQSYTAVRIDGIQA